MRNDNGIGSKREEDIDREGREGVGEIERLERGRGRGRRFILRSNTYSESIF